jgi:type IV fimbrial biogenesis protein FimT
LQAAANDLQAAIDLTRSEAMARGHKVLMAPVDPSGANWQSGWASSSTAMATAAPMSASR